MHDNRKVTGQNTGKKEAGETKKNMGRTNRSIFIWQKYSEFWEKTYTQKKIELIIFIVTQNHMCVKQRGIKWSSLSVLHLSIILMGGNVNILFSQKSVVLIFSHNHTRNANIFLLRKEIIFFFNHN